MFCLRLDTDVVFAACEMQFMCRKRGCSVGPLGAPAPLPSELAAIL